MYRWCLNLLIPTLAYMHHIYVVLQSGWSNHFFNYIIVKWPICHSHKSTTTYVRQLHLQLVFMYLFFVCFVFQWMQASSAALWCHGGVPFRETPTLCFLGHKIFTDQSLHSSYSCSAVRGIQWSNTVLSSETHIGSGHFLVLIQWTIGTCEEKHGA